MHNTLEWQVRPTACRHSSAGVMNINKLKHVITSVFQSDSQGDLNPLCASSSICFSGNRHAGK